jgi:hypothetical protein
MLTEPYRCEKCGCPIGYIERDTLYVTINGVVIAEVVDGAVICQICRNRRMWYIAEWRMTRLLRQRAKMRAL